MLTFSIIVAPITSLMATTKPQPEKETEYGTLRFTEFHQLTGSRNVYI